MGAWTAFRTIGLSLILAVAVATFGCGGGDDDTSGAPGTTSATTAAASGTTTRAATRAATTAATPLDFTPLTRTLPPGLADGMALGAKDAKVTVAVYEDFQCPFCLRYSLTLEPVFVDEYVLTGKVRFEFKNFPILGPESVKAAMAASCAAEQNVFWPFHHRLFLEQAKAGQLEAERLNAGRFSDDKLAAYAVEAGAKKEAFDACFADAATVTKLQEAAREAQTLGLRSTPTWVVGTQVLAGGPRDAAAMRKLLDEALAK